MASLDVINNVTLSVNKPNSGVVVYAKQFDKISRIVNINLISGSAVWDPPSDTAIVVMYSKPDGKKGIYDVADSVELYSNEKTYPAGSEVRHGDSIYTNPNAINEPENWTAAHWTYVKAVTPAVTKTGTGAYRLVLAEQALTAAGNVMVEISFFSGSKRATTLSFIVNVEPGVPDNATLSGDYFNVLSGLIEGLLGAAINPPTIDDTTKNWLLWSQEQGTYVDSGYSSIGLTGPIGPRGYSIASVEQTGGTGAPGTYNTFTVYDENEDAVGSFMVYQGQDAEAGVALGTMTPQADGVGSAGTANAVSRQDHVHPLNVDAEEPISSIGDTAAVGVSNAYARKDHSHPLGQAFFDAIYPVGSVYMSFNNTNPGTLFGGTWAAMQNRFLIGASSTYSPSTPGGTNGTVTLSVANLPPHTHDTVYGLNAADAAKYTNGSARKTVGGSNIQADGAKATSGGGVSTMVARSFSIMPPYQPVYMWYRTA